MVLFYKKWKRCYEIQLRKNKIDLNVEKLQIIHPPPYFKINAYISIQCKREDNRALLIIMFVYVMKL